MKRDIFGTRRTEEMAFILVSSCMVLQTNGHEKQSFFSLLDPSFINSQLSILSICQLYIHTYVGMANCQNPLIIVILLCETSEAVNWTQSRSQFSRSPDAHQRHRDFFYPFVRHVKLRHTGSAKDNAQCVNNE